jgi:O-antigen ligase
MALWGLAVLPIADFPALRREIATPEGGLPVLLAMLAVLGMLWADVDWTERYDGLREFAKLLFVPVVLTYFRQSDAGMRVVLGFLASCIVLLAVALATALWPNLQWWESWGPGVPVRNYITQSAEFTISAFWLLYLALDAWRGGARRFFIAAASIACAFIGLIIFIVTSRTALVVIPVLLLVFVAKWYGRRVFLWCMIVLPCAALIAWSTSSYLRLNIESTISEIQSYRARGRITSTGYRLEFWKKSVGFIAAAPVVGHGTGSTGSLFKKAAAGKTGLAAEVTSNPHNQIFAVAIQLGIIGVVVLCAMWFVHLRLFLGTGPAAWFGLVIVIQTVLGSLFNSHLFDFTEGWIYVLGVGALAGICGRDSGPVLSHQRSATSYLASLIGRR